LTNLSIHEYKLRDKIEKDYERLVREEKTYPKGAVLLDEDDRTEILNRLFATEQHLIDILNQFPVSIHISSFSLQNKKSIIDRKLTEVERLIKTFKMTKVFLKK
jgi:hypothetical protein